LGGWHKTSAKFMLRLEWTVIWLIVAAVSEAVFAEPVAIIMLHPSSNALPGMAHNQADAACV
jgi:hypothetical protein